MSLAVVLGAAACGNTEHRSDEQPMAGKSAVGGAAGATAAGSARQPPA